jgi:peptidoglycan/LPS O-acetylase OafA/YrhL
MTFVFGFLSWGPIKSFVPGGWSIFIEETFYWLFPVLFPLAIQRRRSIYLALALFVVSFVWSHMLGGSIGRFLHPEFVYYFSPYHFYAFGLGFLCYQIYLDGHEKRYMNVPVIRWGLDGVVLLLLICWPRLDQRISSMFLALMIISALDHRTMWGRLVRTRPMVLAGQACYSIYLVHPLVLNFLINNLRPMGYVIFTVVSALVTIAIGIASYTFFERPMIELGRRIVARRLASARC